MRKILVIDDSVEEFNKIKNGLEPVYQIIPEKGFPSKLFSDTKKLFKEIERLLNDEKELVGIILDANLKDGYYPYITDDKSGITDILPAIRNKGDKFSIIPIIVLTKYSLEEETFSNVGSYFVKKETTNLEAQVKTEVRWILKSLVSIYETALNLESWYEEALREWKETTNILLQETSNINEITELIYQEVKEQGKKLEIAMFSILALMPNKQGKIIERIIEELENSKECDIVAKLKSLKDQGKWEKFKQDLKSCVLHDIPQAILVEFGIAGGKLALRELASYLLTFLGV